MDSFDYKKYAWIAGTFALAGIFFASVAMGAVSLKALDHPNGQAGTITVSGEGEVTALPDIATVTVTIRESAATVPQAQKLVEEKVKKAIEALSGLGVEEKDQKTISYTVNPKYEYTQVTYPGVSTSKIVGYEAAQMVEIKVRKIDSAGEIVGVLGAANITEISGPSFTVEDMDKAQAEAKAKAIEKALAKARETARSLHTDLGEIVQFSEDNGGYYPIMYARDAMSTQAVGKAASPEATLPLGESVIKSRVTITYSLD
jgi:uncharacterized protein YggE